jgi:ElaB/YqjD/DUF883 family membrane-anchored ribosome-binding protein
LRRACATSSDAAGITLASSRAAPIGAAATPKGIDMNSTPTSDGSEGLAQGLRQIVAEAEHFLKSAADSGDTKLDDVRGKIAAQVREMRMQLDELQDSTLLKARHAARTADLAAHNHPYSAMGIAAAAGLLIGFLVARRG